MLPPKRGAHSHTRDVLAPLIAPARSHDRERRAGRILWPSPPEHMDSPDTALDPASARADRFPNRPAEQGMRRHKRYTRLVLRTTALPVHSIL